MKLLIYGLIKPISARFNKDISNVSRNGPVLLASVLYTDHLMLVWQLTNEAKVKKNTRMCTGDEH